MEALVCEEIIFKCGPLAINAIGDNTRLYHFVGPLKCLYIDVPSLRVLRRVSSSSCLCVCLVFSLDW